VASVSHSCLFTSQLSLRHQFILLGNGATWDQVAGGGKRRTGECGTGKRRTILHGVENAGLENPGPSYMGWKKRD